ncbi:Serine/threonine-protein kinase plk1 [Tulasnella sp. JGI-2019a]|nr:Serine/threonine-protein kinase plk1 [Tulasnella sp. JGI-2019a]KAG9038080.1 Serine/threonine-protein kinase plk1 [Tulasnella sp. JGI-2019a]
MPRPGPAKPRRNIICLSNSPKEQTQPDDPRPQDECPVEGFPPTEAEQELSSALAEELRKRFRGGSAQADAEKLDDDSDNHPEDRSFEAHYETLEYIGHGGFGHVFKVRRLVDSATKACKVVNYPRGRRGATMMANEFGTWKDLDHAAIIPLDDSFKEGIYKMYYVMPHLTGGSLAEDRKERSDIRAFRILVPIMDALIYMHCKGYIHRDLKPDNILLNGDGDSFLADFGISGSGPSTSKAGTPGWMAPEVETGKELHDHKVDSYAIGLIFWWFLFGPTHFVDKNAIKKVINWSILKENSVPDSNGWRDFLSKLLAEKPANRWTVEMARKHPLVRNYEWSTGTRRGPNASTLPKVTALPTTSIGVPLLKPAGSTPIAADCSEVMVEKMLFIGGSTSGASELSGASIIPLYAGLTSRKRGREASTSVEGPTEIAVSRERSAKRWKGSD